MTGIIVCLAIVVYVFICIKTTKHVEFLVRSISDMINVDIHPVISIVILGFLIIAIPLVYWPLAFIFTLIFLVFKCITAPDAVKLFFQDLIK